MAKTKINSFAYSLTIFYNYLFIHKLKYRLGDKTVIVGATKSKFTKLYVINEYNDT